jgi:hypothetical protein
MLLSTSATQQSEPAGQVKAVQVTTLPSHEARGSHVPVIRPSIAESSASTQHTLGAEHTVSAHGKPCPGGTDAAPSPPCVPPCPARRRLRYGKSLSSFRRDSARAAREGVLQP